VDAFVVAEMNYGQLVGEVERCAGGKPVHFIPKFGGDPHSPEELLAVVEEACGR